MALARVSAFASALLLALPSQLMGLEVKAVSSLHFDAVAAKERPVSKVIALLKDMQAQLQKDGENDEEVYNKLVCWCETNDKEKTKSVAEAESRIADLTAKIEDGTAHSARLNTEIKNLKQEVAKNQVSLDQATELRRQELAAFNAEEKDLQGSIDALKAAITVLSKHHKSLLQIEAPATHVLGVAATLEHVMEKHAKLLDGVLTHSERKVAAAFIQAPSYAAQSGEIFGILKQMHETFESNLEASRKQEATSQQAYDELKAAKQSEIAAGQDQINSKTQELADTDAALAHNKQDLEDTRNSLAADQEFLAMLKEKCEMTDKEWENRQKARALEVEAVSKALAILNSDDAHDTFTRTFNPSLLQRRSSVVSRRRAHAAALLSAAAKKHKSQQLAALALAVRLDAFGRVKQAIADMVTQLLKEKEDEIKHKDFCVEEFQKSEAQLDKANREKQELSAKADTLEQTIQSLTTAIDGLKAQIAETQAELKRAGENRELENKEFQAEIADQRETQRLLESALNVLAGVYGQASFAQAGQPAPAGFDEYKSNASGTGVLDMLKQIITDAKAAEAESIRSEEDAQKAYEDFVKESNASIEANTKDMLNKAEVKARTEADFVATKEAKANKELELEQLSNYNAQLHESCDFVLKNFDLRQAARDEEVEALRQATAILSGAKFD